MRRMLEGVHVKERSLSRSELQSIPLQWGVNSLSNKCRSVRQSDREIGINFLNTYTYRSFFPQTAEQAITCFLHNGKSKNLSLPPPPLHLNLSLIVGKYGANCWNSTWLRFSRRHLLWSRLCTWRVIVKGHDQKGTHHTLKLHWHEASFSSWGGP